MLKTWGWDQEILSKQPWSTSHTDIVTEYISEDSSHKPKWSLGWRIGWFLSGNKSGTAKFYKWPTNHVRHFNYGISIYIKNWLTSKVKIFLQGNGFLPFSDSKNGNPGRLSLNCSFICDFLVFFFPFGLPLGLPVGLYFLFLRFFFFNLSKIAFKVNGLGSKDESLDESLAWTLSGEWTNFLIGFLCLFSGE